MTTNNRTSTATIILLVIGALVILPLLAMGGGMMGYGGFGMFGGGMFLWPLLLVAVVGILYYATRNREESESPDSALATLRERYARGELSDEEFEERRQRLEER